jgi:hypothetical protein
MRTVVFSLMFCVIGAFGAQAQDAEIKGTISQQFDAFRADDFAQAFEFASPTLQQMFRTPDNFWAMVTQGYPMVWKPADVRFLELRETAGTYWQKVMITDDKGAMHVLEYRMLQTDEGWRINGVQILKEPAANA